jgi:Spy/CpxP family protein refolding chaperone
MITPNPTQPPRSRWRSFFVGSALILSGVIVGLATGAMSQGFNRGWSDDGPARHERFDRGFDRGDGDQDGMRGGPRFGSDGPRGWFHRDHGRREDGEQGRRFGGGFGGGMGLTPGRIERMVNRLGWAVDASSEQKQRLREVVQRMADDLRPLREKRREARRQMRDILAAATVDRSKLEALRADSIKLADQASQRVTTALADAAEVLTPEQRADLARRLERFGGRRG